MEEHREKGANVEVDVACMYLRFFEEDDHKYSETVDKYSKGELLTGEVKAHLITVSGNSLGLSVVQNIQVISEGHIY